MQNLMNTILNRRSIRKYTGEEIPEQIMRIVLFDGESHVDILYNSSDN